MNIIELCLVILFVIIIYAILNSTTHTKILFSLVVICITFILNDYDFYNSSYNNIMNSCNLYSNIQHGFISNMNNTSNMNNMNYISNMNNMSNMGNNVDLEKIDYDILYDESINNKNIIYSEDNYKYNIFDELGSDYDNKLAHKQKQRGNMNRVAIDNYSRNNKLTNIEYLESELEAAESRIWWGIDALDN